MQKIIIGIAWLLLAFNLNAQKEDFNWLLGSLSDTLGHLICFTNGTHIYNKNFEIIENGNDVQNSDDYPFGFIGIQSAILLPTGSQEFVLISGKIKYYNKRMLFSKYK